MSGQAGGRSGQELTYDPTMSSARTLSATTRVVPVVTPRKDRESKHHEADDHRRESVRELDDLGARLEGGGQTAVAVRPIVTTPEPGLCCAHQTADCYEDEGCEQQNYRESSEASHATAMLAAFIGDNAG